MVKFKNNIRKICRVLTIFLLIFALASCSYMQYTSSAEKHIKSRDYYNAVLKLCYALNENPKYDKAINLIAGVYPKAIKAEEDDIENIKASSDKFKWDSVVAKYDRILNMQKSVAELPELINKKSETIVKFEMKNYEGAYVASKNNAAEGHYLEGKRLALKTEDREAQKSAAKEFKKAVGFVAGYKDSEQLYEKARKSGMCRMIIYFEDKSGASVSGLSVVDAINDKAVSSVFDDKASQEFLEIVERGELDKIIAEMNLSNRDEFDDKTAVSLGELSGANEILFGKITGITYSRPVTVSNSYQETAEIKTGEKIVGYYEDGTPKKAPIYTKISATFTKHSMNSSVKITGSYKIIEIKTSKIKELKQITEETSFSDSWGTFSGDERALSFASKNLCKKGQPIPPSREE
ncbi:MAG TPA: CsgG/HfaB family protein, partial [Spirochaetota bacterium]|nr:CsgG/HfaB family protein [Spirochaetota bacterium]